MFSLFTRKHRQWGWLCRSRFLLLGCWAFSANWLRFEAINIWKMFCIWCSWILHPYLAVCGMPLFKLLCHPYNQSGWALDGQSIDGSTFNKRWRTVSKVPIRNLLDTQEGWQGKNPKINKNVRSWQATGITYCNTGLEQMKHFTTKRKWRMIGQHKCFLLALSQRYTFLRVLNIEPPIIKLWTYSKKVFPSWQCTKLWRSVCR